jgi:hypothetical protein
MQAIGYTSLHSACRRFTQSYNKGAPLRVSVGVDSSPMDCYPNPDAGLPGRYPTLCELGRKIFIVGDYGKIVLSENRGESWTMQTNVIWDYEPELQQTFNLITLNSVFVRAPAGPSPPPLLSWHACETHSVNMQHIFPLAE